MKRKKILVIDDEKGFTSMLQLNLEAAKGYQVKVENEPLRAVSTALQFKPDVILLDIIMPQKGGPDVAVDIRSEAPLKDIPIIFLTATVSGEELEEKQNLVQGHAFVAKPSNLQQLIASIEEHVASA